MKKIRLTESELIRLIENQIKNIMEEDEFFTKPGFVEKRMALMRAQKENEPESSRGKKFTVEPHIKMTPREKEVEGLFGSYESQIPDDVLRYLRKNPQLLMNRLVDIYGEKFLELAEKAYINQMRKNLKNDNI